SYKCYSDVAAAIFGAAGVAVNAAVLEDFRAEYGDDMAGRLVDFRNTDFNTCR
ncbi:MAG: hypothetical protein GX843_00715, partial [Synergistaceae bacterium]|nr:hypothetical protein [Synergistaceae bacterium]